MSEKASQLASEAARLVGGDRNATHGDALQNHAIIAAAWNGYLSARRVAGKPEELNAEDVANLMECLKIARRLSGAFNADDYIDGAGYASIAGEIASKIRS